MEFNSDGSVDSEVNDEIAEAYEKNKPKFQKYVGKNLVRCAFCDKDSFDKAENKKLEP